MQADREGIIARTQKLVARYLLGKGHPFPQRLVNLVDEQTIQEGLGDPGNYRAKRFAKVLSGLAVIPPHGRKFTVRIRGSPNTCQCRNLQADIYTNIDYNSRQYSSKCPVRRIQCKELPYYSWRT